MTETSTPDIDVVKAEITRNALLSAAQEMNDTLIRSAYNPLIFDVKDFGVGIMSASGELWADAPGLPGFTGVLPASVRSGLEYLGEGGIHEGDVFIVNSPYLNGTHISDTAIYMPVFYAGELVAFTGNMAHWADIGGMSPGGWTVDSTEIYQEGVRFSHQRLYNRGVRSEDFFRLIEDNVRVSSVVLGDVNAQIATCRTGAQRVVELCERYGAEGVKQSMDYIIAKTRAGLHQRLLQLPDGTYSGSVRLDFNGVDHDEIPVVGVQTIIEGDRVRVTFEGTSGISRGPINSGREATDAAVAEAIMGLVDPTGHANEAHLQLADIDWPKEPGLLNAEAPAPCDSYGYVLTALIEIMLMSFAEKMPDRVRAGGYQMLSYFIMSTSQASGESFVLGEPVQGGYGAYPGQDGACLIFTGNGDVSNTPVEVLEMRYPVLCEQFALDTASAGAGKDRGGFGVARDLRILNDDALVKTAVENTIDLLSRGVDGGADGRKTLVYLDRPGQELDQLSERVGDTKVPRNTVLRIRTGGGGGFGSPLERDVERVLHDLNNDYITAEKARDVYGVAVQQDDNGYYTADPDVTAAA